MHSLRRINSQVLFREKLDDAIIAFDKRNMKEILEKATFIVAFNERNKIIGYLEYCPSWDSEDDIYISSLQIEKKHRNGLLLARLCLEAKNDLLQKKFNRIVSAVQKNNQVAINFYRKLGFNATENPKSKESFFVFTDRSILENDILRRYEGRIKKQSISI